MSPHRPLGFFMLSIAILAGTLVIGIVWAAMCEHIANVEERKRIVGQADRTRRYRALSERAYSIFDDPRDDAS